MAHNQGFITSQVHKHGFFTIVTHKQGFFTTELQKQGFLTIHPHKRPSPPPLPRMATTTITAAPTATIGMDTNRNVHSTWAECRRNVSGRHHGGSRAKILHYRGSQARILHYRISPARSLHYQGLQARVLYHRGSPARIIRSASSQVATADATAITATSATDVTDTATDVTATTRISTTTLDPPRDHLHASTNPAGPIPPNLWQHTSNRFDSLQNSTRDTSNTHVRRERYQIITGIKSPRHLLPRRPPHPLEQCPPATLSRASPAAPPTVPCPPALASAYQAFDSPAVAPLPPIPPGLRISGRTPPA